MSQERSPSTDESRECTSTARRVGHLRQASTRPSCIQIYTGIGRRANPHLAPLPRFLLHCFSLSSVPCRAARSHRQWIGRTAVAEPLAQNEQPVLPLRANIPDVRQQPEVAIRRRDCAKRVYLSRYFDYSESSRCNAAIKTFADARAEFPMHGMRACCTPRSSDGTTMAALTAGHALVEVWGRSASPSPLQRLVSVS